VNLGWVRLGNRGGIRVGWGTLTNQGGRCWVSWLVGAGKVTGRGFREGGISINTLTLDRGRKIAKVAMARKLAVRLYWMMRKEWDYGQFTKFGSYAGKPENRDGVK